MKPQLAALIATSAIAITATVFATWASVTDAPWEDTEQPAPVVVDTTTEIRCQAGLDLRERLLFDRGGRTAEAWRSLMSDVMDDINLYCDDRRSPLERAIDDALD